MAEFDPVALLAVLDDHGVDCIVIGGVAARLRGAPILTADVDITPDPAPANLDRLSAALTSLDARLRSPSDPDGVPFPVEPRLLAGSNVWTLTTRHGDLDLVLEPAGTTGYDDLIRDSESLVISIDPALSVTVASLADVIRSKEASGRAKDHAALPLLRRTHEEAHDAS